MKTFRKIVNFITLPIFIIPVCIIVSIAMFTIYIFEYVKCYFTGKSNWRDIEKCTNGEGYWYIEMFRQVL